MSQRCRFGQLRGQAGTAGLGYSNSDVTLYLTACRYAMDRLDVVNPPTPSGGIAIGECWL